MVGRDDRVMVVCAHLFTDGNTVDVARRFTERELVIPVLTIRFPRRDVHRADGVVEIAQVKFSVSGVSQLVLYLVDEKTVIILREEFAFVRVEHHVLGVNLRRGRRREAIAALDLDFHSRVLHRHQGQTPREIIAKEERQYVMIRNISRLARRVRGDTLRRQRRRSFALRGVIQHVPHGLNEK